jgi:hypothetical protein
LIERIMTSPRVKASRVTTHERRHAETPDRHYPRRIFGTCRMSVGSGQGHQRLLVAHLRRTTSGTSVATGSGREPVVLGREQQQQSEQLGAQGTPESSNEQCSEQGPSPAAAASPLISNVLQSVAATMSTRNTPAP